MTAWVRTGLLVSLTSFWCRAGDAPTPTVIPPLPTENRSLAERFAEPPPSARILRILHKQDDQPAAQDRALRQLAAQEGLMHRVRMLEEGLPQVF